MTVVIIVKASITFCHCLLFNVYISHKLTQPDNATLLFYVKKTNIVEA